METSKVYKRRGKCFKYDFTNGIVILVTKAREDEVDENKQWIERTGRPLFDIDEDGYIEVSSAGLMKSNWTNKKIRDEYLDQWIDELEEELAYLIEQYLSNG